MEQENATYSTRPAGPPLTVDQIREVRDQLHAAFDQEIRPGMSIREWLRTDGEVPTTVCLNCDAIIPIADSYHKRSDETFVLCGECFQRWESAGRAKETRPLEWTP